MGRHPTAWDNGDGTFDGRSIMAKFMFVYRGGHEKEQDLSPEAMQKVMQSWWDWIQGGIDAGWMVDGGDALKPEGRLVSPSGAVTDGPFAESKELVGGYSMVKADSLDEAVALTKGCPMFDAGGTVEVRELADVGKPVEA